MGFLHIFLIFIWKMRDRTLKRYSLSLSWTAVIRQGEEGSSYGERGLHTLAAH